MNTTTSNPSLQRQPAFVTTHWSVVLTAGRMDTTRSREALASLCETYWYPLYAYVRRRGHSPEDAQDLTQEFFARLLAHNWVADADRTRGRFRTFLLTALNRFLANEWDRAHSKKRGGGAVMTSFDTTLAEQLYKAAPGDTLTPDRLYDRQWALTLLDRALTKLAQEHAVAGRTDEFSALSPYLTAERGCIPYESVAHKLGMSESAARQAVHRLRKQFRATFLAEISQTLNSPEEAHEEMRHLLGALAPE